MISGRWRRCTTSIHVYLQDGTWGTDTMTFQDDELSYALGKQGGTRQQSLRLN